MRGKSHDVNIKQGGHTTVPTPLASSVSAVLAADLVQQLLPCLFASSKMSTEACLQALASPMKPKSLQVCKNAKTHTLPAMLVLIMYNAGPV